jgi:hypothetical protein
MQLRLKLIFFSLPLIVLCVCISFSCKHKKVAKGPQGFCLSAGTNVRLANGKDILIENLKIGDTVLAFDRTKNNFTPSKVLRLAQTSHEGFVQLKFPAPEGISENNYSSMILTNDHPIWVKEKGWCSVQPEITKRILGLKEVGQLKAGDICFSIDPMNNVSEMKLTSIEKVPGVIKAYTIVQLENNLDCFLGGNIVVGTESMQIEEGGE